MRKGIYCDEKKKMIMGFVGLMVFVILCCAGCAKETEPEETVSSTKSEVITIDSLRADYMSELGWEYEDELIADFSERSQFILLGLLD